MTGARVESAVSIRDYWSVIWRHRLIVVVLCAVATISTFAVSKLLPKVYLSTASLLVPRESTGSFLGGLAAASSVLQQVPGLTAPSLTPNRDMLVGILKSRTVAEATVKRVGLEGRDGTRDPGEAVQE